MPSTVLVDHLVDMYAAQLSQAGNLSVYLVLSSLDEAVKTTQGQSATTTATPPATTTTPQATTTPQSTATAPKKAKQAKKGKSGG